MKFQVIGSGDAFGSGGRFNTCFHVNGDHSDFLIDCGASSLIALKAHEVSLNQIRTIFITHFHADHFGGIPFFMLDAQLLSRRKTPLTLAGPAGLSDWYRRVMETAFPDSTKVNPGFEFDLVELVPGEQAEIAGTNVRTYAVEHGRSGGPFHAYRFEVEGRTIAYTGDTQWVDTLVDVGRDADLFVAEAYFFERKVKNHLDLKTLKERLAEINPKRLLLTHMSPDMLNRIDALDFECASDGLVIDLSTAGR